MAFSFSQLWQVLRLFLLPIGGGIPGGVVLARELKMHWSLMMTLYFVSDVMLAIVFEPCLILFIEAGKRIPKIAKFSAAFKEAFNKSLEHYGHSTGPFSLIIIAFGVDPMTGRGAAMAAGHGFITGWMIAIAGDMIYFSVLMVSTLWLNNILGDGTTTTYVMLGLMIGVPMIMKRFRKSRENQLQE